MHCACTGSHLPDKVHAVRIGHSAREEVCSTTLRLLPQDSSKGGGPRPPPSVESTEAVRSHYHRPCVAPRARLDAIWIL